MSKGDKRRPSTVAPTVYDQNHPFPVPTAKPCTKCGGKGLKFERGQWTCTGCGRAV